MKLIDLKQCTKVSLQLGVMYSPILECMIGHERFIGLESNLPRDASATRCLRRNHRHLTLDRTLQLASTYEVRSYGP